MREQANRRELAKGAQLVDVARRRWLKQQVIEYDRIDILAKQVLGLQFAQHHLKMAQHQLRHRRSLTLAARGFGKTTISTILRAVHLLVKEPNLRILIATKSASNAEDMLAEIKAYLQGDELQTIFGPQVGDGWGATSIRVAGRTSRAKEPSISVVGVESAVVSKHYDVIIADDLVDEENARSSRMRNKLRTFWYKHVLPCLEPNGWLHVVGTRYHGEDLYNHFIESEFQPEEVLIIPAMTGSDEEGWTSAWPEVWSVEALIERRRAMGSIIFASQYLCDVAAMNTGGIIELEDCNEASKIPTGLPYYMGVDLAISKHARADYFAAVRITFDQLQNVVYVLDYHRARYSFAEQQDVIVRLCRDWKIAKCGIETINYEVALVQELLRKAPDLPVVRVRPHGDKTVRAQRLSARFERGGIQFKSGLQDLIAEIVAVPEGEHDDGFDALDYAIDVAAGRRKKTRTTDQIMLL